MITGNERWACERIRCGGDALFDIVITGVCDYPTGNTAQGLCDMADNVGEWVQDEWHSNYNDGPIDGSGYCAEECPVNAGDSNYSSVNSFRVLRGGLLEDSATGRMRLDSESQAYYGGGRLARD